MDDNTDIAFLAASCERNMKSLGVTPRHEGSTSLGYNRTDFRRFLGPGQLPPNHPNNQYPQHPQYPQQVYAPQLPPQYPQYPPNHPGNIPVDPNIPAGTLAPSNAPLLAMPPGYGLPPQHPVVNMDGTVQPMDSFQMPNYNQPPGRQYLDDEQEFRDALIKEVKAQKKNINKLLREMESLILLVKELKGTQPLSEAEPLSASSEPTPDDTPITS